MKKIATSVRRRVGELIARRTLFWTALAVIFAPKISMGILSTIELQELQSGRFGRTRRKTLLRIAMWWAACIASQIIWPALIALVVIAWRKWGG